MSGHGELRAGRGGARGSFDHGCGPRRRGQFPGYRQHIWRPLGQRTNRADNRELVCQGRRSPPRHRAGDQGFRGDRCRANNGGLSALNIRLALDASLTRLQTDYIDLYQFHHVDRATPWDEIWQSIEVATRQGKIIYAGSSNFAGWHIAQAQEAAARRGLFGLVSEQSIYNLLRRDVELEVLPAVRAYGLGFLAWAPLHEGILGGRRGEEGGGKRRQVGRAAEASAERGAQLAQFEDLAVALGYQPGELALAWLLSQPGVTAPIIGPRHLQQLASAVRAHLAHHRLERAGPPRRDLPGASTGTGRLRLVTSWPARPAPVNGDRDHERRCLTGGRRYSVVPGVLEMQRDFLRSRFA